jgi:hypothetical protein
MNNSSLGHYGNPTDEVKKIVTDDASPPVITKVYTTTPGASNPVVTNTATQLPNGDEKNPRNTVAYYFNLLRANIDKELQSYGLNYDEIKYAEYALLGLSLYALYKLFTPSKSDDVKKFRLVEDD